MNYVILPLSAIEKSIYPLETIYKHRWIRVVRDAGCLGAAECSAPHFIFLLHGTCSFSRFIEQGRRRTFPPIACRGAHGADGAESLTIPDRSSTHD
jgi:hypothetical protein